MNATMLLLAAVLCASIAEGGILDSIKGALGFGTTQSSIQLPAGSNLPNYFRVETELVRLQNAGGIKSNGGSCDTVGACDPIVYSYMDLEKPALNFPGSITAVEKFPKVFEVDNNNSPNINFIVKRDVCNKELSKATVRVHVMDKNALLSNSLISDFDCAVGGSVANSLQDAKWSSETACAGKFQADKIKFFVRSRIYRIDQRSCNPAA